MTSVLEIEGLRASVAGSEILRGVDLTVRSGEVHAVMGPNGSGKSTLAHVVMGRPGYDVVEGSVRVDGRELLGRPTWERAHAGLFLAMQYPIEVPGVSMAEMLGEAYAAMGRPGADVGALLEAGAARMTLPTALLSRPVNVGLSGGEKKASETVQLGVLRPRFAVLDEIDSGLDLDMLRVVARRIESETAETGLGVLAITHYSRLLHELHADHVHVLVKGRIAVSGGPELAQELEQTGYAAYGEDEGRPPPPGPAAPPGDPFADPLL